MNFTLRVKDDHMGDINRGTLFLFLHFQWLPWRSYFRPSTYPRDAAAFSIGQASTANTWES